MGVTEERIRNLVVGLVVRDGHVLRAVAAFRDRFGLPAGLTEQRAVDVVWTLNSPEVHGRLVHRCGWTHDQYEDWLAGQLAASLT